MHDINPRKSGAPEAVYQSEIEQLELVHRGKVRDVYQLSGNRYLFVATDRLSAFDVVLPDPIPGKGKVLTQLSNFWFARTADLVPNHCLDDPVEAEVGPRLAAELDGRAVVVKALEPLPVEAIVRGYLIGSGWKDYQSSGAVCGIELPAGLRQAEQLPEVLFTPSTKAAVGDHDENISFEKMIDLVGEPMARQVREVSIELYRVAAERARARGIIIADTKFEFGLDGDGRLTLMDEVLTPDSSRFWPADEYRVGVSPPSFDKQFVRDYLESIGWNKAPPAPSLPPEIIERTAAKYREARSRLEKD